MPAPLSIPNEDILQRADLLVRQDPPRAIELLVGIIDSSESTALDVVRALLLVARARLYMGHLVQGEDIAAKALDTARLHGLRRYEGLAQNEKGIFRFVNNDFDSALAHYAIAEQLISEFGTEVDLAKVLVNRGNVFLRTNDEVRAIDTYEKAAALAYKIGDPLTEAKVNTNMAGLYSSVIYDVEAAIRCSERAITLYRELNDTVGLAKSYVNLANQYRVAQRHADALVLYRQAIELRKQHFEPSDYFTNYHGLILTLIDVGDIRQARAEYDTCSKHEYVLNRAPGVTYFDISAARLFLAEGRFAESYAVIQRAEEELAAFGYDEVVDEILGVKIECLKNLQDHKAALETITALFQQRMSVTKHRAEFRLVKLRAHYDFERARAEAELERMRNEELAQALDEARRLEKKNAEYSAFMAHELKSPLTTIRSIARILATDGTIALAERQELAKEVFDVSTHMFDLITQVLRIGMDPEGAATARVIDVRTLWQHVLGLWRHRSSEKFITVTTEFTDESLLISGNEASAISILDNLVSNAVKFSPVGSTINVSVRRIPVEGDPTSILLSVRDQGPGLTASDLDRLFTAYGKASPQPTLGEDSTGLGLLIVKREVELLNGRVWCESIAGSGATFYVELPIANEPDQLTGAVLRPS